MLDAAADHVSLCYGDDVRHTVTGVDHRAREGALGDLSVTAAAEHEKKKNGIQRRGTLGQSQQGRHEKKNDAIYGCVVDVATAAAAETLDLFVHIVVAAIGVVVFILRCCRHGRCCCHDRAFCCVRVIPKAEKRNQQENYSHSLPAYCT